MNVAGMSNEQLISELQGLVGQGRVLLARLLAYLAEVEERRLDLESACSSLFDFCVRRLAMSEDEACRRVAAARLTRRFPVALEMIERGELHLTGLLLLRDYLTNENHQDLLKAASGKTKAEVQELIAARFPRRDAPPSIEPVALALPLSPTAAAAPAVPTHSQRHAVIEPLSPERYKVEFTASAKLRDKILRAKNLSMHQIPSGDLATLVERAFDVLLEKLERQRLGKTKRAPRPSDTRPSDTARTNTRDGHIPMAVRREVFERDGEQCTFVDELGRRCPERAFLELDHRVPRARGGTCDAANLTVKCRKHNALAAERAFGRQFVEKCKAERTQRPRPRQRQRQRGYDDVTAARALRGLGFKEAEIRRALSTLEQLWAGSPPPLETILRDAIQVLT